MGLVTDLSDKVCTVYDYGWSIGLARRLSREFGLVRYFRVWKDTAPESTKLAVGTGYDDIERVRHFHDIINSTDLFVFPDIYDADLQHDLEMRGHRVWGSRRADRLEYDRQHFLKTVEQCGLPVPHWEVKQGVDALEEYLSGGEKRWVKLNNRGDSETWCSKTPEQTQRRIEAYRHKWGPIANDITFTVVDNVETDVEAAYDGFLVTSVDGKPQFPEAGFLGYEAKDKAHILRAIPYDDFPDSVRVVNDKFAPALAKHYMRSAFGTEIKVIQEGKEEESLFLDATCRQPNPPGPIIMEQVGNLGEFFWHGSVGELIPLEIEEEFGVQVNLYSERNRPVEFDEELDPWIKLVNCCKRDGINHILPDDDSTSSGAEQVGCVVALGKTIEDAIDKAKEICDGITGEVECEVESLGEVLKRIKHGEEQGIEFAEVVPEPAEVIDG